VATPVRASAAVPRQSVMSLLVQANVRVALRTVVLPVLVVAAIAWTVTVRAGSGSMGMSLAAFVGSWVVMMVAMMLPAVAPVAGLYALAARKGTVAAVPFFLAGYLLVWVVSAAPAYAVARAVNDPLMNGRPWMARVVGATLVATAVFQLTPLKAACLRQCRSPLTFFMARKGTLSHPTAALRAGAGHGLYCLGCCWALMAVLIVLGGMQLAWALALAAVITVEKLAPFGEAASRAVAAVALGLGVALLVTPSLLTHLIAMPAMSM
jgi:predicted metal-binding membrane protein